MEEIQDAVHESVGIFLIPIFFIIFDVEVGLNKPNMAKESILIYKGDKK